MTVEDLHTYKKELTTGLNRNLNEFEKNFFFVSAGTFTFSITFIKDIVKIQGAACIFFLFLSWILIAASVALIMYTFLASASKSGKIWNCVDDFIAQNSFFLSSTVLTDDQVRDIKSKILQLLSNSKNHLRKVRNLAAGAFISGIFSFALFISINLSIENEKSNFQTKEAPQPVLFKIGKDSFQIQYNDTLFILKKKSPYETK